MRLGSAVRFLIPVSLVLALAVAVLYALPAAATVFFFSTGSPDGQMGMGSRPPSPSLMEIEAADDFILTSPTIINHGTFVGLLPSGLPPTSVTQVDVQIYRVFPADSANPPDGRVPTRTNSPSDVEFADRSTAGGDLSVTTALLNPSFTVANTVLNGIHPIPNQFTGGEGPATGEEVLFNVTFTTPFNLPADHYFFVPQVATPNGNFFWLSAPRPIVAPGTPFTTGTDLQTWIRNADLAPDWLRVGTDITHQGPFNGTFSLDGTVVPEPSSLLLMFSGTAAMLGLARFRRGGPRGRTL
jgi:hypothetical protein